jgi:hypothetical protein
LLKELTTLLLLREISRAKTVHLPYDRDYRGCRFVM